MHNDSLINSVIDKESPLLFDKRWHRASAFYIIRYRKFEIDAEYCYAIPYSQKAIWKYWCLYRDGSELFIDSTFREDRMLPATYKKIRNICLHNNVKYQSAQSVINNVIINNSPNSVNIQGSNNSVVKIKD